MFEWRELFIPTILERGNTILQSNISDVQITEEGITAKIKGAEEYELLIRTGLKEMTCTCPFATQNNLACKHMAAILIFCENNRSTEMEEFFKDSENSPFGKLAIKYKANRLEKERINAEKQAEKAEKERIAYEKYQEWLKAAPQRKAEQEEKARLAEERRKEKAKLEEERRIRREERERKRLEKQKAEGEKLKKLQEKARLAEERRKEKAKLEEERRIRREERERKRLEKQKAEEENLKKLQEECRQAEERWKKQREEWEARRKKEQEEWERNRPIREANEKREAERRAQEVEEQRQKELDKKVARKRPHFPKVLKDELAEIDEQIKRLEEAERDPSGGEFDTMTDRQRLEETGWYYSDKDELEGEYFVDKYGKEFFIPKGFHPEFHK